MWKWLYADSCMHSGSPVELNVDVELEGSPDFALPDS